MKVEKVQRLDAAGSNAAGGVSVGIDGSMQSGMQGISWDSTNC